MAVFHVDAANMKYSRRVCKYNVTFFSNQSVNVILYFLLFGKAHPPRREDVFRRNVHFQSEAGHLAIPGVIPDPEFGESCFYLFQNKALINYYRSFGVISEPYHAKSTESTAFFCSLLGVMTELVVQSVISRVRHE